MNLKFIEKRFEFAKHGTNLYTEITAGISTFLALSYIFFVHPSILADAGMDKSMVLFATVITSSIATFLMGYWAKKPFVLAPGLEMNSYVVYFVILGLGFLWQEALGAVFWSGIIFIILTVTKVRIKIINAIPDSLKSGLSASVGIFLILIALRLSNLIFYKTIHFSGFGNLFSKEALIFIVSFSLILVLKHFKVQTSVLFSIIISSVLANFIGIKVDTNDLVAIDKEMFSGIMKFDPMVILNPKIIPAIFILFVIDFYGSIAKFIGLTMNTSILDKDGKLPNMKQALSIDGYATILGSGLGTTSVTTFVESGIGIGEGARTGFSAIICSLLMLLFIPLSFLLNYVPTIATTGALLYVGFKLIPRFFILKTYNLNEIVAILLMVLTVLFSFSLDKAMLVGFSSYIIGQLLTREFKQINIWLVLTCIILIICQLLQYT